MKAILIGHTQPTRRIHAGEPGIHGLDNIQDLIAFCARVSNPSNQANTKTTDKLLHYLAKHKHWSPFEMCSATIEVETTRDIARQLLRHRSFSFQEFSQRYANPQEMKNCSLLGKSCSAHFLEENRQAGDRGRDSPSMSTFARVSKRFCSQDRSRDTIFSTAGSLQNARRRAETERARRDSRTASERRERRPPTKKY